MKSLFKRQHEHREIPETRLVVPWDPETVWRWCRCGAVSNGHWGWQYAETVTDVVRSIVAHHPGECHRLFMAFQRAEDNR